MTGAERRGIRNAIWLCRNCSIEIDRDLARYPAEVLFAWKLAAEKSALEELGRRLPGKDDARQEVTSALTGLPATFAPKAISNVHAAVVSALGGLDPRIAIETSYSNSTTQITFLPKENTPLKFKIEGDAARD